jgi:hypothetical protein
VGVPTSVATTKPPSEHRGTASVDSYATDASAYDTKVVIDNYATDASAYERQRPPRQLLVTISQELRGV